MSVEVKAELRGHIDNHHHLVIEDREIPLDPQDVTILILPRSEKKTEITDDLPVDELLRAAQAGGSFDFWNDPEEDIYSMEDGKAVE